MNADSFPVFAMLFQMLLLGVLPMAVGILFVVFARRRGPGHAACGKCGYNVRKSIESGSRCPECGSEFADVGITPPQGTGRRNTVMMIVGVLLIVWGVGWIGMWILFLLMR